MHISVQHLRESLGCRSQKSGCSALRVSCPCFFAFEALIHSNPRLVKPSLRYAQVSQSWEALDCPGSQVGSHPTINGHCQASAGSSE